MPNEKFDEAAFEAAISGPNGWDAVADPVAEVRRLRGDDPAPIQAFDDLRKLESRKDSAAARRDARMLCQFFELPVPEWARRRNGDRHGIRATSKADYLR